MRRDSKLDPNDEILSPQSWPPPPYSRAGFMATWRDHRGQFILEWDLLETSIQSGQSSSRCCQYQCGWYVTQLRNPVCQSLCSFLHLPVPLLTSYQRDLSLYQNSRSSFSGGSCDLKWGEPKTDLPSIQLLLLLWSTTCSRNHTVLFGMSFLSTEFVVDIFSRCLLNLAKYIAIFCFRIIVKHL